MTCVLRGYGRPDSEIKSSCHWQSVFEYMYVLFEIICRYWEHIVGLLQELINCFHLWLLAVSRRYILCFVSSLSLEYSLINFIPCFVCHVLNSFVIDWFMIRDALKWYVLFFHALETIRYSHGVFTSPIVRTR